MSLYNKIAQNLSNKTLQANIKDGLTSATNPLKNKVQSVFGSSKFAKTGVRMVQSIGVNSALNSINKHIPLKAHRLLNTASGALGDIMQGDFAAASFRILDSGLIDKYLKGQGGTKWQERFLHTKNPLLGGLTPALAKQLIEQTQNTKFAKKNLFLIEITSNLAGGSFNLPQTFNLLITEIEYSPCLGMGEKLRVGGAVIDVAMGVEPVELRITTLDDVNGTIKKWFNIHHKTAYNLDGTVSPPLNYAIRIKIMHAGLSANSLNYQDLGLFRPVNLDTSLSRRDSNLQELNLTFTQLDTFLRP